MGPPENPTNHPENQEAGGRKRRVRRPRSRRCLLKGCERRFRPRHARQRYCSDGCRKAARVWSRWKAQQKYRVTAAGKQKRNGQSRHYRERQESKTAGRRSRSGRREGNHYKVFSMPVVTGRGATRGSCASGARRCRGSARTRAGGPWSASGSASGAGTRYAPVDGCGAAYEHGGTR